MATIKQAELIQKLLAERVWDKPVVVANLSVGDASVIITALLKAPKKLTDKQKARLEKYRLYEEAQAKARAEQDERDRIELENCERCKNPGAGPSHGSCLYRGRAVGHSRSHCSAKACF
jgi:hypothetical protein